MPNTERRFATRSQVQAAIDRNKPFGDMEIILLTNRVFFPALVQKLGNVIVLEASTGKLLFAAPCNWVAADAFDNGWKYDEKAIHGDKGFGLLQSTGTDLRRLVRVGAESHILDAIQTLQLMYKVPPQIQGCESNTFRVHIPGELPLNTV